MNRSIACLLFFSVCAFRLSAQNRPANYEERWKKIDSLINKKGLTQSALQEVNTLYTLAKKEKNEAQSIKALLYRMGLQEKNQEDAVQKNITELEKEISTATEPSRSVLNSILAETYWSYLQQNRWKFYDRTRIIDSNKRSLDAWTIDDFNKKISGLYLASLRDQQQLQKTRLEPFDPIIIKGNVRYLRPTLYDLLAHRALDYFKNDERDINKPAFAFEIADNMVFADRSAFATHHFTTRDTASLHVKALLLFQQLLQFHANDPRPDALLDADIERISFAYQYGVMENKDSLYAAALKHITDQYGNEPAAAQAWYLQAQQYANQAGEYNPAKDTANRYAYLKAKAICENIMQQKDSSEGKSNCGMLLKNILRRELHLQTEKVNIPNQPFRVFVSYRNFTQLHFRLMAVNHRQKQDLMNNRWQEEYWKKLLQLQPFKTFSQSLPATGDYQQHKVEVKVDGLPVGEYALLASVSDDFSLDKNPLSVEYFYVSGITYINHSRDYFVLDRETGKPLERADVQAWYRYYDNKQNRYLERKGEQFSTDKNGYFHIEPPKTNNNNNLLLELTQKSDHLFMDDEYNIYYDYRGAEEDEQIGSADYEKNHLKTFFFTDRSIYRPGQTVYFKGITVTRDFNSRKYKVVPQFKTKVILYDANDEEVDSIMVSTNDFGSYNGKFRLPENGLNGEFRIRDDSTENEQSFSVEEYKRPKFYVEYDTLKGSYRLQDTIRISGAAKAYAGNAIDGAAVKYRVVRQARFPYPWLYWRWGIPASQEQEITHGEAQTNAEGKFGISFAAIPDNTVKKELDPVFEYKVMADITDINGETRSGETVVSVGYKSLNLSIDLPAGDNLPADSLKSLLVKTTNLSNRFEPANVSLVIYKLKSPDRLIRGRYWPEPDQFLMTREEYLRYFPNDEYSNETKKETWEKTDKVFETSTLTKEDQKLVLSDAKFKEGWYVIEAKAKDKYGAEVKNIKYVQLYDTKTGNRASPEYNWTFDHDQTVEPGSKATVNIGSSANDLFVIQSMERGSSGRPERSRRMPGTKVPSVVSGAESIEGEPRDSSQYQFITVSKGKKSFSFPVTESDRGDFAITHAFVKNNRLYSNSNTISVPWTNKELQISYASYRDKTLPGSEEKWKIKISGNKNDQVAAEVLTSMYDASLDQFKQQGWGKPDLYPNYYVQSSWNGRSNFSLVQSQEKYWNDYEVESYTKVYDVILRLNNVNNRVYMTRGGGGIAKPMALSEGRVMRRLQNAPAPAEEDKSLSEAVVADYSPAKKELADTTELLVLGEKIKKTGETDQQILNIRKNFNETAFFFPDLKTDTAGNIEFSFTMPEALTKWKWMILAHTKDLSLGYAEKSVITQKQLMVQPNAPRFLREGDHISLSAKIVNLTDSALTGQVELQLLDQLTNQPVDGIFINRQPNQYFTAEARQSTAAVFNLEIPYQYNKPVTYRIIAKAPSKKEEFSDGEEATLPVLSNRMLVTESLPLNIRNTGSKNFKFEKLLKSGQSETLQQHALTVEFTANPAWYAVQALPYLIEYPYECAEQNFNRFYANALASRIAGSSPRIRSIFENWKTGDTSALLSNLQKNPELKSVLLEETPWVLEAKTEAQQKKNIALLFDMTRMNKELGSSFSKLQAMQSNGGGFPWFKEGPDDRYITQYILSGIGHLKKLNALPAPVNEKINELVKPALAYLDKKIKEDYEALKKRKLPVAQQEPGPVQIQYLYMRSFFGEYAIPGDVFSAVNYYRKQSQQYWLQQNKYMQGMIALSLFRTGDIKTAKDILASLKQNAVQNEETGMYWLQTAAGKLGYYWHQSPVEAQSLLIEAFQEIGKDAKTVNDLKTWLLKQKQTQNWGTTRATSDACYALLLQGADWLGSSPAIELRLGNTVINSGEEKAEAGTGYFKKTIDGRSVKPEMGNITVSASPSAEGQVMSWGAVYWQYFENLDKISTAASPLKISKSLFVERNSDHGPVLEPVSENGTLKTGDKIKVRIELRTDRDLEYVHMKDMRAACMEPAQVLSQYKWQGGLGYYETTKDAATHFFFDHISRGTYVFEYPLFVSNTGTFSNGITSIQCMYAPEFAAHSEGIRVNVETKE